MKRSMSSMNAALKTNSFGRLQWALAIFLSAIFSCGTAKAETISAVFKTNVVTAPTMCWSLILSTYYEPGTKCSLTPSWSGATPTDACNNVYTNIAGCGSTPSAQCLDHVRREATYDYSCWGTSPGQSFPTRGWDVQKECPPGYEPWVPTDTSVGDDSLCYKYQGNACPPNQNWTLSGANCTRPDCTATQVRNEVGLCIEKSTGKSAPEDQSCNIQPTTAHPIMIATGDKYYRETGYQSRDLSLNYGLTYTNRISTDAYQVNTGHGLSWISSYGPRLAISGTPASSAGAVSTRRPNGQLFGYRLVNSTYVPDADISNKLAPLTNEFGAISSWRLFDALTNQIEAYYTNGNLASIASAVGKKQTLVYDSSNRLTTVTDVYGRSLTFGYDTSNRVSVLMQPDSKQVLFGYDANNNLSTITWPDGKVKTFHYENSGLPNSLTGITDENGVRYATYGYDTQGRAYTETLALGADETTLSFGTNSTTVTDARGTARTYNFQTILDVARSTGSDQPGGSGCGAAVSAQTYDANGNIASRTDFNGNKMCFSYDLSRNLEIKRVEGVTSAAVCTYVLATPPAPTIANPVQTISTQWHSYWRLPVKIAEPKKLITYGYNGDSYNGSTVMCAPAGATVPSVSGGTRPIGVLCRKIEQATTDATGNQGFSAAVTGPERWIQWTYDQYGNVLTRNGPRVGATDVNDITTYTYHAVNDAVPGRRGNLATITNAVGHVTQIPDYDANGRPLTIIDPNGVTTTLVYDLRGRLTSKTTSGEVTSYQYDGVGQLTKVTLPDTSYIDYTYDAAHRLTDITDSLGNTIHYTLDAMGNRTKDETKDPLGTLSQQTTRVYDALNRLQTLTGAQQ